MFFFAVDFRSSAAELPAKTTQFSDGRIVLPRADSKSGPDDSLMWNYKPTRWGMYTVEAIFATNTPPTDIRVEIAGQILTAFAAASTSNQPFHTLRAGPIYFPESKPYEVRATSKNIANLEGILLRPAPEGQPILQKEDSITLHARDAITHSVVMRYEPATNKNCLGYWTNPNDTAEWKFTVTKPGTYEVELWQGCGKGQGGSAVLVEIFGPYPLLSFQKRTRFIVEDTGHFQNFVPRHLGQATFTKPAEYTFFIGPMNKKAAAVMDVRQIVLKPASPDAPVQNRSLESVLANQRVIFLGDSITYSGEYIEYLETYIRLCYPGAAVDFINLGLPSETISGLSEEGHAGGQFPRPDLHERLDRVLAKAKPDIIFACYGMNDGIYHPYSQEGLGSFQRGLDLLRLKTKAQVIHITPPTFDPVPLKGRTRPWGSEKYDLPYEAYNDVLDRYSSWLVRQRTESLERTSDSVAWEVIDIHTPMNQFLAEQRKTNPKFVLAGDGVHANAQGHWIIAREILRYLGAPEELTSAPTSDALLKSSPRAPEVFKLLQQRQRLLKDAWLTHVGHKRPGMNKGKPLPEAVREAAELSEKIASLAKNP
jgi:lysophospholipase L1-like esterase